MLQGGKKSLPWRLRVQIACDAARGLEYFHTRGPRPLVHRDVKSANVLLDSRLRAKLADYGFARFVADEADSAATSLLGVTSNVVGTQAYMAPEAFRGDVSVKLDVFGFGVVLLELITGMPGYDDRKAHPGQDLVSTFNPLFPIL
jgi:interleukin-1 receptor-associated kinase 4